MERYWRRYARLGTPPRLAEKIIEQTTEQWTLALKTILCVITRSIDIRGSEEVHGICAIENLNFRLNEKLLHAKNLVS